MNSKKKKKKKKKKIPGRPFEKGKSGNPLGRPKISKNMKELRKLNALEFNELLTKYIRTDPETMKLVKNRKGKEWLEHMAIGLLLEILETQDITRIQFVLDRTMGRDTGIIRQEIEVKEKKEPDAQMVLKSLTDPENKKAYMKLVSSLGKPDSTKTK